MKRTIWLFALIMISAICASRAYAEKHIVYSMGDFTDGAQTFLCADRVNVRSAPSLKGSEVIANLPYGHAIRIVKKSVERLSQNGFTANWYQIQFKEKGAQKTGYAWGGFFSYAHGVAKIDSTQVLFVSGLKHRGSDGRYFAEIAALSGGRTISRIVYAPIYTDVSGTGEFGYSVYGTMHDGRKLSGVKSIIELKFEYPACAYANGSMFFVFDGKRLIEACSAVTVSEAGVFHMGTVCLFPNQKGGRPDRIVCTRKDEDFDEEKKEYVLKGTTVTVYQWDGTRFFEEKK